MTVQITVTVSGKWAKTGNVSLPRAENDTAPKRVACQEGSYDHNGQGRTAE
ncbi:MAG: hypothetical protein K2O91_14375 [Lachnospiraceae bacterium]|nr:hypothetical protein [Lachnospiraceae bacterium]